MVTDLTFSKAFGQLPGLTLNKARSFPGSGLSDLWWIFIGRCLAVNSKP